MHSKILYNFFIFTQNPMVWYSFVSLRRL